MSIKTTYTYWSVYRQLWVRRADSVPDEDLAAMSRKERERTKRHLECAPQREVL